MQSLDGLDFVLGKPPVLALGQPPEPHRPVGNAVQPFDLQAQRLGEPPDDALATFRKRDLDLGAALYGARSEEHTSELQSRGHLVCRLLLEKKKGSIHSTFI